MAIVCTQPCCRFLVGWIVDKSISQGCTRNRLLEGLRCIASARQVETVVERFNAKVGRRVNLHETFIVGAVSSLRQAPDSSCHRPRYSDTNWVQTEGRMTRGTSVCIAVWTVSCASLLVESGTPTFTSPWCIRPAESSLGAYLVRWNRHLVKTPIECCAGPHNIRITDQKFIYANRRGSRLNGLAVRQEMRPID